MRTEGGLGIPAAGPGISMPAQASIRQSPLRTTRKRALDYRLSDAVTIGSGFVEEAEALTQRQRRKREGTIKHYAHQIAHVAAGWEIVWDLRHSFDGGSGEIFLNLLDGTAEVDGEPRLLGIFFVVRAWLDKALARDGLNSTWVRLATVTIRYRSSPSADFGHRYDLVSVGRIETADGADSTTVENYQYSGH
jgi:hypothetical protein